MKSAAEQQKQELIGKLQQLQRENPRCVWLQAAVDMNNSTDSTKDYDGKV